MRLTWKGFLRTEQQNPTARALLRMGGHNAFVMEERLRQRLRTGRIDQESFDLRMKELMRLLAEFRHRRPMVADLHSPKEWVDLGNGGWRRRMLRGEG